MNVLESSDESQTLGISPVSARATAEPVNLVLYAEISKAAREALSC